MGGVNPILAVGVVSGRGSLPGQLAGPIDDSQQLVDRFVEVVVDQNVVGQLEADRLLRLGFAQAVGDLVLSVAALTQPPFLLCARRWQDEDQDGVRSLGLYLLGAVDLDLQDDIAASDRFRERRAVQAAEELGPLEEPAGGDVVAELLWIDEVIRRFGLTVPA